MIIYAVLAVITILYGYIFFRLGKIIAYRDFDSEIDEAFERTKVLQKDIAECNK